jgi:hypothetical protein
VTVQPPGMTLERRRFPRCCVYSVVQVLLVAPIGWMCVRLTGGTPERDGDNQRRTRRSNACFLLLQLYGIASELSSI